MGNRSKKKGRGGGTAIVVPPAGGGVTAPPTGTTIDSLPQDLPPELLAALSANGMQVGSLETKEFYSGPFPHPRLMKEWEATYPGACKRIFDMAEKEANHRQDSFTRLLNAKTRGDLLGTCAATWIGTLGVVGAVLLFLNDKAWQGGTVFASLVIGIITVLITRKAKKAENIKRRQKRMGNADEKAPQQLVPTMEKPPTSGK